MSDDEHGPVMKDLGDDDPTEPRQQFLFTMGPQNVPIGYVQQTSLTNSRRWFPMVHDRGDEASMLHLALGIGGESGELLDVIKKMHVCGGTMDECEMHKPGKHSRQALEDEMADVLTYLMALADLLGVDIAAAWFRKQAECEERWG